MSDKKAVKYVKRMLPLFHAVVKFCSTNRLFYLYGDCFNEDDKFFWPYTTEVDGH